MKKIKRLSVLFCLLLFISFHAFSQQHQNEECIVKAYYAGVSDSGSIAKNMLPQSDGIFLKVKNCDKTYKIKSFRLTVKMKMDPVLSTATGNRMTDEMRNMIKRTKAGDQIIFDKIVAKDPDSNAKNLNSILIRINEDEKNKVADTIFIEKVTVPRDTKIKSKKIK